MMKQLQSLTKSFYTHFNGNKAIIKPWHTQKFSGLSVLQAVFVQFLENSLPTFHHTENQKIDTLIKPFTTKDFAVLAQLMKRYLQP